MSPFLFLEVKIQTKLEAYWTWVRIAVDTTAYLRVDTLILGNDEWVLYGEEDASAADLLSTSLDQSWETVTQCHVAALQVRSIAYKIVTTVGLLESSGISPEAKFYCFCCSIIICSYIIVEFC